MNELLRRALNLPPQSSSMARSIDTLHYTVILATMAGVTLAAVFAAVFLLIAEKNASGLRIKAHTWNVNLPSQ